MHTYAILEIQTYAEYVLLYYVCEGPSVYFKLYQFHTPVWPTTRYYLNNLWI